MNHWMRSLIGIGTALLLIFAAWAYGPALTHRDKALTFKPEGLFDEKLNFRDAGLSINECSGQQQLPAGKLLRASEFFSGWSCARVGEPDVIYSLNFVASDGDQFYCRASEGVVVGRHFQTSEISDIELPESWHQKPEQTRDVCQFLLRAREDLQSGKRVLVHCEAGRDRTGAVIALLAAMELETRGPLTDQQIAAIECDYRKSKSLKPYKYGRMTAMLQRMRELGGVTKFLTATCRWSVP
jgi:hypothetical protein